MLKKLFFLLLFFISLCFPSSADLIYLKNNTRIEGIILEDKPDEVIVQLDIGTAAFNRNQIEKINRWTEGENQTLKEKWLSEKEKHEKLIEEIKDTQSFKTQSAEKSEEVQKEKTKDTTESIVILREKPKKSPPKTTKTTKYKKLLGRTTLEKLKKHPEQTYYFYLPKKYSSAKKWPLFIGIHGYRRNGMDAMDDWKEYADREGFILVGPNFRDGYQRLEHATDYRMIDIIKELRNNFRIDENKIFMAGFSGGGMFVSRFVFRQPNIVRAASIMSARWFNLSSIKKSVKTDFLVTIGENDTERISDLKNFVQHLRKEGYDIKFKTFPGVDHWMCDEAKKMTIDLFREMKSKKF